MRDGFIRKASQRKTKMENRNSKKRNADPRRTSLTLRRRERREKRWSDEEIKDEKKKAQEEKNGGTVDAAARKVGYGTEESHRDGFEAGFSAECVERAGRRVAGEVAAEKGKLIVEPHGEIAAAAPHERATSHKQKIAENGQEPECRACSPIHKSSQAAHTICLMGRLQQPEGYSPSWMVTRRTTSNSFFPAGVV